jgi:hypothetical protein
MPHETEALVHFSPFNYLSKKEIVFFFFFALLLRIQFVVVNGLFYGILALHDATLAGAVDLDMIIFIRLKY